MNNLYKTFRMLILAAFLGLSLIGISNAQVCTDTTPAEFEHLNPIFDNFKVYPSMTPRIYIKVSYDFTGGNSPYIFDPKSLSNFVIVKKDEVLSKRLKIEKFDKFTQNTYLVFDAKSNGLKKGDELNIGICVNKKIGGQNQPVLIWDTNDPDSNVKAVTKVPNIETYTINLTPDVVPDQELVDGTKKTVGQMKVKLDIPSLVTNNFARFYFNTDNVISTNWRDKNSKLETRFGAENSLTRSWYVPANLEVKVNGDQRLKNSTFVTTGGVRTILPWAWTKKGLFNQIIRAPVSPEFGVNVEFHRRLKQDAAFKAKFPNKNSFALTSQFAWLPIQLFTGSCIDENGNRDVDKCYSARNISLEVAAKGWWFPYEKTLTGTKVRRLEGRGEVSLLIPIGNIADQFGFKREKSGFASRVRVKYTFGANDAAGFKRSSQFTFGIEAIK